MNQGNCEKFERSVKGKKNKDVRKNPDRSMSAVTLQARTQ